MEVYVLVEKKKSLLLKVLQMALLVSTITIAFMSVFMVSFLPVVALAAGLLAFLHTRNYEYEYSYFAGEIKFAKIINKSSRKNLKTYNMEEVLTIAPSGERSVYHYENDEKLKVKDYTSREKNAKTYVMIVKEKNGIEMIKFEPDEKILDAICVKYNQKVVR